MIINKVPTLESLEQFLDLYLNKKAPSLPQSWRGFIVKILPWLTLIFFLLSLPAVLAFVGINTLLSPVSYLQGIATGFNYTLAAVFIIITLALEGLAIPGLFKKIRRGWLLLYYSTLVNALYSLIVFNLVGLVLGTLISLYILFQVRSYYT